MSIAAAQYANFVKDIVQTGCVFTFTSDGHLNVYRINGREIIPFWSSHSRLEKIQAAHPKYQKFGVKELSFSEFEGYLDQMEEDKILVGTNWAGERLVGYDTEVADLRAALTYQRGKTQPTVQPDGPASGGSAG